ncbi:MAG: hypothetical protein AB1761_16325 [Pseudomonadota bacterium]
MLRFVASIMLALGAGTALAANIDPRLAKFDVCGRYEIFHINGIQTSETDANDNRAALIDAYGNSHNEHLIAYRLAYNPSQGALLDLVDVFAQKLNEYPGATFAMIVRAFLGRVRDPLPVSLADELQRILIERIRGTGYVSLNDTDLARVVDRIRRQRLSGAKTLLVPHSQGSLYANSAYALLTQGTDAIPAKSLAIVAVASPAAYVAGANGRHVTSRQDLVIFGLRKLLGDGSVLPGNVSQPLTLDDPLGHNFQATYLRLNTDGRRKLPPPERLPPPELLPVMVDPGLDTDARTKLLSDIAAVLDSLRTDRYVPSDHNLFSRVEFYPEVAPMPPRFCKAPGRLMWWDGWSNPGQYPQYAVRRFIDGAQRGELEGRVKANLQECYAKARDMYERFLRGEGNPAIMVCGDYVDLLTHFKAWRIHSGDRQEMTYQEEEDAMWSSRTLHCPDGSSSWTNVRLVYGVAYLRPQCNW